MIKPLLMLTFIPKKITKQIINKNINIRKILFLMFGVEFISIFIKILNESNSFGIQIVILSIVTAVIGIYIYGGFNALVLFLIDKCIVGQIINYKICFKLILPRLIIDVLCGVIFAIIKVFGISVNILIFNITMILQFIYFVGILSYYLRVIYDFKVKYLLLIDVIYFLLFIIPKILKF